MKIAIILAATLAATSAHAWDCNYWSQSSDPSAECYKAPAAPAGAKSKANARSSSAARSNATANQHQVQTQTQAQRAAATVGDTSATGGNAQGGESSAALDARQTAVNSNNTTFREAAIAVQPTPMMIQGCQVMGQAGGSTTRAAAMLGIGFTPKQCYDYIQAQAYLAIGALQAACEILNHTEAAQRAVKNGAVLPACAPPAPPITAPGMYTRDQVDVIVRKAVAK